MTEQATEHESCAAMNALADAHAKFEPFVGTFTSQVTMWMGPGDPMVSTGVMVNSLDLGGRFLRHDYKGDPNDGPFTNFAGRGFWGFNTVTNKYEGFWIDNASTLMQNEVGEVDASGKVWTMIGHVANPQTGKPMRKKSVITLHDRDAHTMEMYFEGPDGSDHKAMEITYRRA